MAEINPTDAIPATNASNTTRYFNLPLFIATDKPSWLVDWNGAMNEIDSILQDINNSASGAESDVETVVTQVNQLSGVVSNLESLVQTAVSDVANMQTTVDSHEERMDGIETDLITQNNLIKSLSDAVTTMQATVGTLNSRVSAMETTVAGYDSRITSAEQASASASATATQVASDLQSLQSTVNTINSSISSLNSRVTAIENQSMYPFFNDLSFTNAITINKTDFVNSQATFTVPEDCFLYIYGFISQVTGSLGYGVSELLASVSIGSKEILNLQSVAPNLGTLDSAFQSAVYGNRGTSSLVKVKAGTVITIHCNISNTYNCAFAIYTSDLA